VYVHDTAVMASWPLSVPLFAKSVEIAAIEYISQLGDCISMMLPPEQ
jgi:hypothetical protein